MTIGVPKPTPRAPKEPKRLKSRPHVIPESVRRATFEMWGTRCMWCFAEGGALDLHHKRRRSQGGADHPVNLRPVHRKCHSYIHEHPTEAKSLGLLL